MADKERTMARYDSVAAESEQSFPMFSTNESIPETDIKFNIAESEIGRFLPVSDTEKTIEGPLTVADQFRRYIQSKHLETVTMSELYTKIFQNRPPLIENLLYPGTYLFAGAPKLGKSFLMMELAYHVATGTPLWGYPVRRGTVLYLALEDDQRRLQERLYRMFGTDCTEDLYMATRAETLSGNLMDQLMNFYKEHPETALIIIDTLQKIREIDGEKFSYSNDYDVITKIKEFSDLTGICVLLVHHTRKQQADDKFEMISGTNGLMGAADGAFLLYKEKRISSTAVLNISGRDQPDQTLYRNRNEDTLAWDLDKAEMESQKPKSDPVIEAVVGLLTADNPCWCGTATELVNVLRLDMNPNTLTMKLNINASKLLNEYGVLYTNIRNHAGRMVTLELQKNSE